MTEKDRKHLQWLYDRLKNVHNEDPFFDYMLRLKEIIDSPPGEQSDGYHTLDELYEHRHCLFLSLLKSNSDKAWFSLRHSDGELPFGSEEWFIAGLELPEVGQVTYHLPISLLPYARTTGASELPQGIQWDGHSPQDVANRLKNWIISSKN